MIPLIPPAAGDILTDKKENWEVLSALFTESGEGGARKGWDVNAREEKKSPKHDDKLRESRATPTRHPCGMGHPGTICYTILPWKNLASWNATTIE